MHVQQLLSKAGIRFQKFPYGPAGGVFLTAGNQLIGSYADLKRFQAGNRDYAKWHAHHVLEFQDLERTGARVAVPRDQQLCVLLPEAAHSGRINGVLRRLNPSGTEATEADLKRAYAEAYALVGNYCGGGEAAIRQELLAIVNATIRLANLAVPA